jgi:hypothetical protein
MEFSIVANIEPGYMLSFSSLKGITTKSFFSFRILLRVIDTRVFLMNRLS